MWTVSYEFKYQRNKNSEKQQIAKFNWKFVKENQNNDTMSNQLKTFIGLTFVIIGINVFFISETKR